MFGVNEIRNTQTRKDVTAKLIFRLHGAETNYCRIARNLGILLLNSNCFAMYFQQHSSYVCSDIYSLQSASLLHPSFS